MAISLTIAGTERSLVRGTLDITERANERNMLRVRVLSTDGSFRPTFNDEIIVSQDGTRIFGGYIEEVSENLIGGETAGVALEFEVTAVDYNSLADRRFISQSFPSQILKTSLTTLVSSYLADYGVSLDGAQVNGPTLPALTYIIGGQSVTEVLNDLCALAAPLTGPPQAVVWEIDYNKVLRAFGVLDSGHTAPFNVTSLTAIIGDTRVRPMKTDFANYVLVHFGTGTQQVIDNVGTGNGVTVTFPLHYFLAAHDGYVNVGGTVSGGVISGGTNETLGPNGSGATWTYDPTPYPSSITRTSAPGASAIYVPYYANFPSVVSATTSPAASARVDRLYKYPDIFDYSVAQGLANSLLQQASLSFKEVTYLTALSGCHPGQTQTITLTKHGLSGSWTITQVRITDVSETQLWYEITAVSGTTSLPESFADTYKNWNNNGGNSISGGSVVVVTGPEIKQSLFLGGNESLYRQDPTPTWVAVDAVRIRIDTNIRGTLTGTARVRLRAASGNVTARLRNLTDSTTAGTSSVVSSSSWTDADFAVTLTAGSKVYELQLLPSVANVDVAGVGYFE